LFRIAPNYPFNSELNKKNSSAAPGLVGNWQYYHTTVQNPAAGKKLLRCKSLSICRWLKKWIFSNLLRFFLKKNSVETLYRFAGNSYRI
jgi:hypothetical protein